MQLTAPQFIYGSAVGDFGFRFLPGECRVCGGPLFEHRDFAPARRDRSMGKERKENWKMFGQEKAKKSGLVCPACLYLYYNSNDICRPQFGDPGLPLRGLLKIDRRGSGKFVLGIIATAEKFMVFDKDMRAELGEALCDPPDPPFVVMVSDERAGIQYGPWQSMVAMSKKQFPVYFAYNVDIHPKAIGNRTLVWVNPEAFRRMLKIASVLDSKDLPDSPDWMLAQACTKLTKN